MPPNNDVLSQFPAWGLALVVNTAILAIVKWVYEKMKAEQGAISSRVTALEQQVGMYRQAMSTGVQGIDRAIEAHPDADKMKNHLIPAKQTLVDALGKN